MKRSFSELIAGFPDTYRSLMTQEPMRFEDLPKKGPEGGGIYVFSDGDKIKYVGRTKQGIRSRLRQHYKADDAREGVQKMGIHFVEEPDPWKQALFEIYVAAESGAEYNDFDTH